MPFKETIFKGGQQITVMKYPVVDKNETVVELIEIGEEEWATFKLPTKYSDLGYTKGRDAANIRIGSTFKGDKYYAPISPIRYQNRVTELRDTKLTSFEYMLNDETILINVSDHALINEMYICSSMALLNKKDKSFEWITEDNTIIELTATECVALCEAFYEYKSNLYLTARELKDSKPFAEFKEDKFWSKEFREERKAKRAAARAEKIAAKEAAKAAKKAERDAAKAKKAEEKKLAEAKRLEELKKAAEEAKEEFEEAKAKEEKATETKAKKTKK